MTSATLPAAPICRDESDSRQSQSTDMGGIDYQEAIRRRHHRAAGEGCPKEQALLRALDKSPGQSWWEGGGLGFLQPRGWAGPVSQHACTRISWNVFLSFLSGFSSSSSCLTFSPSFAPFPFLLPSFVVTPSFNDISLSFLYPGRVDALRQRQA